MRIRRVTMIAACLFLLPLFAEAGDAGGSDTASSGASVRPVRPVRPVTAIRTALSGDAEMISFPGRAEAAHEVNLAFEVSGTLIERRVDKGDRVKRGTVLARLDPRDFRNALNGARAEEARARAHRDRIEKAAATGAVARQELTNVQAALDVAVADVKIKAKALEDTVLTAPFDGIITAAYMEVHQQARGGVRVVRLVDHSKIEFTIDIPEKMISGIHGVTGLFVRFDAFPGRCVPARIKEVGPEASRTTRTYPVTLAMDQPGDMEILPGMAGKSFGRLQSGGGSGAGRVTVPLSALFEADGKSHVWTIDGVSGIVEKRAVRTGALTPGGILVKEGLVPGIWIATAGVHSLREGQQVRILDDRGEAVQ